jgi:cobalt/nickel transport protein
MFKKTVLFSVLLIFILTLSVSAHFQLILPTDETISNGEAEEIGLQLIFTHPMEASHTMEMNKPEKFAVVNKGREKDLTSELESFEYFGSQAWKTNYKTKAPGDYLFYLEPAPYYEASEDAYITQYTKVVVNKMGMPSDWDREIGQKAEIVPLARPYGLWTGNSFRAIVKKDGKAVPYAEVEIEYLNEGAFSGLNNSGVEVPADSFYTQVVKADKNGVFAYSIPKSGWWGFAALMEGEKIEGKDHEIGAVMWVKAHDMN